MHVFAWSCVIAILFGVPLRAQAQAQTYDWSIGAYAGKYYDTEPAGFLQGNAGFV